MFDKIYSYLRPYFRQVKKIVALALNNFIENDCYSKSAALTFFTVQSIVPSIAFLLGIAKGFGFDAYFETLLLNTFSEQKEIAAYSISIAKSALVHAQEGVVIGAGVLLLIWAIINLLGYIEIALNQIWKIKIPRNFFRKITDYLAIIIICPLIFIVSSSFTVYLKTHIANLQGNLALISPYLLALFKMLPLVLSWCLFFLLYYLMPNAKLRIWPLAIAAVIAGTVFQIWQAFYINFQIQAFNYNVIYGTFAVLPLLLIWLQISWLIALGGAELASSMENLLYYVPKKSEQLNETINKKQLGLLILFNCLKSFYSGTPPLTEDQLARTLEIPLSTIRKMLHSLLEGNILAPTEMKSGLMGYRPFCDPGLMTIKKVCDAIDRSDDFEIAVEPSDLLNQVRDLLKKMEEDEKNSAGNITLNGAFLKPPYAND
jgi:membrane protein